MARKKADREEYNLYRHLEARGVDINKMSSFNPKPDKAQLKRVLSFKMQTDDELKY